MATHAQNSITLNTIPAYTSLLGGHFRFGEGRGANVVQFNTESPQEWGYNTHVEANGIQLRYNTDVLSEWTTSHLKFFHPNSNTADATLDVNGLITSKGGIEAGTKNTNNYIYLYSHDDENNHKITINGHEAFDWRIIAGNQFGVDKGGNLYAANATINGKIIATSGQIGNWYIDAQGDSLYYESETPGYSDTNIVLAPIGETTTNSIAGSTGSNTWKITVGTKFGVTDTGILHSTGVDIQGIIKADTGSIAGSNGWTIASQEIYSTGKNLGANDSMYLATKNLGNNTSIGGRAGSDWRLTVGSNFGITNTGVIYAKGAYLNNVNLTSTIQGVAKTRAIVNTNGLLIYDGDGTSDNNIIAKFGSKIQMYGKIDSYDPIPLITIDSNGIEIQNTNEESVANFGVNVCRFGSTEVLNTNLRSGEYQDETGVWSSLGIYDADEIAGHISAQIERDYSDESVIDSRAISLGAGTYDSSHDYITITNPYGIEISHSNSSTIMVDDSGTNIYGDLYLNNNLYIKYHDSPVGSRVAGTNRSSLAVATDTDKWVNSIKLTKGTWIVVYNVTYPPINTTGYRIVGLTNSSTSATYDVIIAASPASTIARTTKIVNVTAESTTYYVWARQTSGSTLTVTPSATAIRIV